MKKSVVLFALDASYSHSSPAIRAIGAGLTRHGIEHKLIEYNLKNKRADVLHSLISADAGIYGFSTYIWNVDEMMAHARDLKAVRPDCVIVFGGPEVSFRGEKLISEYPFIDYVISGEGEESFPLLCESLFNGEQSDRVIYAPPYPDFEKSTIYYGSEGAEPSSLVYYESVRGCPFNCSYCLSSRNEKIRAKSVPHVIEDILGFEKFPSVKTVKFVDRTFNYDKKRAVEIWRALCSDSYTKEYHFEVCASLLNNEAIEILKSAPKGKFRLEIGVQSTNPETLRAINREDETADLLAKVRELKKNGNLHLHLDLIAGLPLETYTRFSKSFDDVYGAGDVLQLGFLKILCGCNMEKDCEKYGIVYSKQAPYRVLYTNSISYEELFRLEKISDVLERFANSGNFKRGMDEISKFISPFAFFESFSDFIEKKAPDKHITQIGQIEAYKLLMNYCDSYFENTERIREALSEDYLQHEVKALPAELQLEFVSQEEIQNKKLSKTQIAFRSKIDSEIHLFDRQSGIDIVIR